MSWVTDCLQQKRETSALRTGTPLPAQPPPWQSVWKKVARIIEAHVLEFNEARGPQYTVSSNDVLVQVVPKQPPTDLAVFYIDPTGVIQVDCPIPHPGTPRRGQFKISEDLIVPVGNFLGLPQPGGEPMTPEQFSEFILKPLLFP
jgi:hypothetical protein